MTSARSARNTASESEWVTKTTVMPRVDPERAQLLVEPLSSELVERGERLVEQEQLRLGDERPRDRDAHAHASRELVGIAPHCVGELDIVERTRARRRASACETPRSSSGSATLSSTVRHGKRCAS